MSVGPEDVAHFATLARLRLTQDELERLTGDVNSILEHVDALRDVGARGEVAAAGDERSPTAAGEAPASPDPLLRPPSLLAPEWRDGYYVVPRLPGVGAGDPE